MASTLPNPSANHNEIQSRLLGDSLRHHEETNIWSKNTDINTFRGNVETKDGFEKLHKGIDTGNKLLVQQNEETDNQTNSLARAFALVGALSIIRFRTVIKDTKDIVLVKFSKPKFKLLKENKFSIRSHIVIIDSPADSVRFDFKGQFQDNKIVGETEITYTGSDAPGTVLLKAKTK